jgi:pentatricopeptide repeat protein
MARLGKSDEAQAYYRKALALDPGCASAHFNLAITFAQAGAFGEAESHFRQALPGKPSAETHNGLGFVLVRQGREDEAVTEFRKAIAADPHFVPAYNNLAEALVKRGKLEEAEHYYRLSLAEKPSPAVQNALDAVLRQLGKTGATAPQLGKAQGVDAIR